MRKIFVLIFVAAILAVFNLSAEKKLSAAPSQKFVQTVSGDIYIDDKADFKIDDPLVFLSREDVFRGDSGLMFHKRGKDFLNFGAGSETDSTNWSDLPVDDFSSIFPLDELDGIYDYYDARFPSKTNYTDATFCDGSATASNYYIKPDLYHGGKLKIENCNLLIPADKWFVFFVKNLDINEMLANPFTVQKNGSIIFIVEQNIKIKQSIRVEKGGFAAFIAGNDIDIDKDVIGGSELNPDMSGVFIAKNFKTKQQAASSLYLDGIFIAKKFYLEKKGDPANGIAGEVFTYRPEFLLLAPNELKEDNGSFWQMSNP